jgi:hypothetical protein
MQSFRDAVEALRRGDYETAERGFARHLDDPRALHNLGVIFSTSGRIADAEFAFRASLRKRPGYAHTEHSLAMLLLRAGRWDEGWPLYESRRQSNNPAIVRPPVSFPEWKGEPLAGRRLLVYREQGFGDEIMFSRLVAPLRAAGAIVQNATYRALVPLFARAGLEATDDVGAADFWIFAGSIPLRLGLRPGDVPPPLLSRPSRGAAGVGVCPTGSTAHPNNANRSLFGQDAERLLGMGRDLRPEATGARNFLETAEIVSSLRAVVTVDTSLAHLSASLGVPTVILLPARGMDWRWGDAERSVWYPDAVLVRQRAAGDWSAALDAAERLVARTPAPQGDTR